MVVSGNDARDKVNELGVASRARGSVPGPVLSETTPRSAAATASSSWALRLVRRSFGAAGAYDIVYMLAQQLDCRGQREADRRAAGQGLLQSWSGARTPQSIAAGRSDVGHAPGARRRRVDRLRGRVRLARVRSRQRRGAVRDQIWCVDPGASGTDLLALNSGSLRRRRGGRRGGSRARSCPIRRRTSPARSTAAPCRRTALGHPSGSACLATDTCGCLTQPPRCGDLQHHDDRCNWTCQRGRRPPGRRASSPDLTRCRVSRATEAQGAGASVLHADADVRIQPLAKPCRSGHRPSSRRRRSKHRAQAASERQVMPGSQYGGGRVALAADWRVVDAAPAWKPSPFAFTP